MSDKNIIINDYEMNIDIYTILKDIWKYIVVILLVAGSAAMVAYVYVGSVYYTSYESTSTFIVNAKGSNNSVYSDLDTTTQMATKFSEILNSSVLQKKVAKTMNMDTFPGSATAEVISETNLLVLKVRANTPLMAFKLNKALMDNYSEVTDQMIGSVVLEVLQKPTVPSEAAQAFRPNATMKKAFSLVAGFLILVVAVWSFIKDTIRKPKEIERKLDGRLLETLYHEKKYKTWKARVYHKKTPVMLTNPGTSFRYVENMKKLARKVSVRMQENDAKVLLVTSVEPKEGRSTVAANLGLALAEEAAKVLLIDGDFRHPSQYQIFGFKKDEINNIGEVLNGNESVDHLIQEVQGSSMLLMANTKVYLNSTEMLAKNQFKQVVEVMKKQMDYIIIDTPAMKLAADVEELSEVADASILVVKQHTALVKDINEAIDVLSTEDHQMLGCVYNDAFQGIAETAKTYGYRYGYGSKYGYGGYGYGYGYGSDYGYGQRESYQKHDKKIDV